MEFHGKNQRTISNENSNWESVVLGEISHRFWRRKKDVNHFSTTTETKQTMTRSQKISSKRSFGGIEVDVQFAGQQDYEKKHTFKCRTWRMLKEIISKLVE